MRLGSVSRPRHVSIAIGLFWLTIVLGLLKLCRTLSLPPGAGGGHGFTVFTFVVIYSLMTLITIYIGMGASWARGGMLFLCLVGILPGVPVVFAHFAVIPWLGTLTCAQAIAEIVGLYLVYREPAATWFGRPLKS